MQRGKTITALATAPAPAGVAIIRISGERTKELLNTIFKSTQNPVEHPREMILGEVVDPEKAALLDQALGVFFPKPKSFTGEDQAELHLHGSPVLAGKILRLLYQHGAETAEPGEFTRRAFENNKLDLVQAEAINDLISASSEKALNIAAEQLAGKLSKAVEEIGEPLKDALAEIEAYLDFPEEDIKPDEINAIQIKIKQSEKFIQQILSTYDYGQTVKEGYRVLICGRPNAGKSSLLNQLLNTQRAIVTSVSGTTRDILEESATIDGYKFVFCDSAGITETDDEVEKIGIELAIQKLTWANLVLLVIDAESDKKDWQELLNYLQGKTSNIWLVVNKIDLNPKVIGQVFCDHKVCHRNIYISALDNTGITELRNMLVEEVLHSNFNQGEANVIVSNERQRSCLEKAIKHVTACLKNIEKNQPLEIISIDLRTALNSLEEIVGKVDTEELLGRIFSKFCIGK